MPVVLLQKLDNEKIQLLQHRQSYPTNYFQ